MKFFVFYIQPCQIPVLFFNAYFKPLFLCQLNQTHRSNLLDHKWSETIFLRKCFLIFVQYWFGATIENTKLRLLRILGQNFCCFIGVQYIWQIFWTYLVYIWDLSIPHLWDIREISGRYLRHIWVISGTYLRHIKDIFGTFRGYIWDICGSYLIYIWNLSEPYMGHICDISRTYLGHI